MIQDIFPSTLKNEYKDYKMRDEDSVLVFSDEGKLIAGNAEGRMQFFTGSGFRDKESVYLFSVDDRRFFLLTDDSESTEKYVKDNFSGYEMREIRDRFAGQDDIHIFVAFTAYHLWRWYSDNRYCGRCGKPLAPDTKERALRCPDCGNMIYPRINPAVIVGVTRGDTILLTRYRRGYQHNTLIAGFTEIGETLEETVKREVMEETGVPVKNIRYYKSQPWGMAQDILVGFFCDAEEGSGIHMDENELKYAEWVRREDIVLQPNNLSLTNEMMHVFREGLV